MPISVCPSLADLELLFHDELAQKEVEDLEQHLLLCIACLDNLRRLSAAPDTLTDMLVGSTQEEGLRISPVIVGLMQKLKSMRATPFHSLYQGTAMIALICTACQQKVSVTSDAVGTTVPCPSCGQQTFVPTAPAISAEHRHGAKESACSDLRTQIAVVDQGVPPTHPPLSNPDATIDAAESHAEVDASLIDFLAPPQAKDELGRLGKYRILRVLGHGGMGVVYQAEDPRLKRTVAIKAILPTLAASASAGKRFLREAQTMAAVKHDHIVNIYDVDEDRGVPFLAMEFLLGESLDERLRRDEQVPLTEVLRMGREVAEGLAAAHATGLVHRDIKPANVWLEFRGEPGASVTGGRVKILDFGLARAASQDAKLTQQGAIIGTPAYMAPEQGRGDAVDARCDLFSLGVVLYRMCTGKLPFQGSDTVSTLMAVAMHNPLPPKALNANLPPGLSDLVMNLLEKDTARRIDSADAVVRALRTLEQEATSGKAGKCDAVGITVTPGPDATKERATATGAATVSVVGAPPYRRNRRPAIFAALFLLLALGAGAGAWMLMQPGVIRIGNEQGDYVIDTDDPDFTFSVSKDAVILEDRKTKRKYNLKVVGGNKSAGELELDVTDLDADLSFKTKNFTIRRGQQVALKAWFERKRAVAVDPPVVVPSIAAGYALRFEDKDRVDRVDIPSLKLDTTQPYSVEAWVNLELEGDQFDDIVVLPGVHLSLTKGYLWFSSRFKDKEEKEKVFSLYSDLLPKKKRVHVAVIRDREEIRLYVAGKLAQKMAHPAEVTAQNWESKYPAHLGNTSYGTRSSKRSAWRIDQVRISNSVVYDRDFTPSPRLPKNAATLALYHFDEGAGSKLTDSSGNGHHGNIVGAKWVKADGTEGVPKRTNLAEAIQQGNVPAPDFSKAAMLFEDHFTNPKSGWSQEKKKAYQCGYAEGRYFIAVDPDFERNSYCPKKSFRDFACEVVGSIKGDEGAYWELEIEGPDPKYSLGFRIDGKRNLRVLTETVNGKDTVAHSVQHSAIKPGAEFNRLLVVVRHAGGKDMQFEIYINGVAVAETISSDFIKMPCNITIGVASSANQPARAEFQSFRVVSATDLPTIEGQAALPSAPSPSGNHALEFDGKSSHVDIPSLTYETDRPVTLEARVKFRPTSEITDSIIGGYSAKSALFLGRSNGKSLVFLARRESDAVFTGLEPGFAESSWLHLAAVWDGTEARLYVDGKRLTKSIKNVVPANAREIQSQNFMLGAEILSPAIPMHGFFNGLMDEVRISKVARYTDDFKPQHRFEPDKDTVALYHFDEGKGDKLTDSSGNGHHGKIVGAKWVKGEEAAMSSPAAHFKNALGMEFAPVPKGNVWPGGGGGKPGAKEVDIKSGIYLGVHEGTWEEWTKLMRTNPRHFSRTGADKDGVKGADEVRLLRHPVEIVSWDAGQKFIAKEDDQTKEDDWPYRLPTEAEWNYSCRGGPMTNRARIALDF